MQKILSSAIGRLRLIAFVEGTSFLIILFITMPLKYMMEVPQPNYYVGMAHGIFFILYIFAVLQAKFLYKWNMKTTFLALLASVIPFGTFWADRRIFSV